MKKTLLKDIAEKLGVSVSQVSRALNHREYVSDEIRERALRLAKEMNYHNASWRHKKNFAVLLNHFSYFAVSLLNRILIEDKRMGCTVSIIPHTEIDQLNDQLFDGALAISRAPGQLKWCEKFRMPLVVLNQFGDPVEHISSVFPDADHEVRTAMGHLLPLGHRKIARIRCRAPDTSARELRRGVDEFYRIAKEHGIRDQVLHLCVNDEEQEIESVLRLAKEGYTAFLVVMNDGAPRLLHSLRRAGLRVPEDISLITYEYDGAAYLDPPLTTLEYDYDLLVRTAFEQLFRQIGDKKATSQIQIPCRLNIRHSTAACADGAGLR